MTIYSKTELEGIDNRIYRIQRDLNNRIEWSNFDIYGRLYISDDGKFKIANAYTSDGEHKDIFFDDKKTAIIGFIVDDNRDGINISVVPVNIVCSCKIDKIYNSGNMNDENIIQSLLSVVSRHTHSQSKCFIKIGLSNVFSKVSYERFKYRDLYPWMCVSIQFNLIYKNNI